MLAFLLQAEMAQQPIHFLDSQHEQPTDKNRFGHLAIFIGRGLKGLPRRIREAVQVQTVIPIGAPDQW